MSKDNKFIDFVKVNKELFAFTVVCLIALVWGFIYFESPDRYLYLGFLNRQTCRYGGSFEIRNNKLVGICDGEVFYKERIKDKEDIHIYLPLLDVRTDTEGDERDLVVESTYLGKNKWSISDVWYEDYDLWPDDISGCLYTRMGECPHHVLGWENPNSPFHDFGVGEKVFYTPENVGYDHLPELTGKEAVVVENRGFEVVTIVFVESGEEKSLHYDWLTFENPTK